MIHYSIPYSINKDLGKAYNDVCRRADVDDHICIMDGDITFCVPNWGNIIQEYVDLYPDAVLTCRTNRIHRLSKQLDEKTAWVNDIEAVMKEAEARKHLRTVTEIKPGEGMSGLLMVIPRHIWKRVPFIEGNGCLGIDSNFRQRLHMLKIPIYIMDGMLVYHCYRLLQGIDNKSHLL